MDNVKFKNQSLNGLGEPITIGALIAVASQVAKKIDWGKVFGFFNPKKNDLKYALANIWRSAESCGLPGQDHRNRVPDRWRPMLQHVREMDAVTLQHTKDCLKEIALGAQPPRKEAYQTAAAMYLVQLNKGPEHMRELFENDRPQPNGVDNSNPGGGYNPGGNSGGNPGDNSRMPEKTNTAGFGSFAGIDVKTLLVIGAVGSIGWSIFKGFNKSQPLKPAV